MAFAIQGFKAGNKECNLIVPECIHAKYANLDANVPNSPPFYFFSAKYQLQMMTKVITEHGPKPAAAYDVNHCCTGSNPGHGYCDEE